MGVWVCECVGVWARALSIGLAGVRMLWRSLGDIVSVVLLVAVVGGGIWYAARTSGKSGAPSKSKKKH